MTLGNASRPKAWKRRAPSTIWERSTFKGATCVAAQRLHERALAICRRNEPDGLDFATSLYRLGNVAWRRGTSPRPKICIAARSPSQKPCPGERGRRIEPELTRQRRGDPQGSRGRRTLPSRSARNRGKARAETVDAMIHNLGKDPIARQLRRRRGALPPSARAVRPASPGSARDAAVANTLISLAAVARDRGDLRKPNASLAGRSRSGRATSRKPHLAEDREVSPTLRATAERRSEAGL